ncbi:MAG: nicotinate phosphoribosyltransferase [Acidimicrobiia bacterium]|nr:nicotinate phosphoribosyltransferase [Acidimicrobiia bacterium]
MAAPVAQLASTALLTDHYELTMLEAAIGSGTARHRAVFEVFCRHLPPGRRYGVLGGVGRLVDDLAAFRFGPEQLDHLARAGVVSGTTLDWLAGYRFSGTVLGYREGEPYFPGSPVLTVDGPFAEGLVLETLVLSVLNHDSAIAAAGARMVAAAKGRALLEAGSRRTHEWAAVAAARAAYLVGFAGTSNLEAGRRFGVPTGGTASHAFTLAYADERAAFAAQARAMGPTTTMLVDTYDVEVGIHNAVAVAGPHLGGVRIDSGDLAVEARHARDLLDGLGARETEIVVSGDLDEHGIARLAQAPVDRMLVGAHLVSGAGHPSAGLVYKLVAVADEPGRDAPLHPVAKRSVGKTSRGGVKFTARAIGPDGRATAELVASTPEAFDLLEGGTRALQAPVLADGRAVPGLADLEAARRHHRRALAELPQVALELEDGEAALVLLDLG